MIPWTASIRKRGQKQTTYKTIEGKRLVFDICKSLVRSRHFDLKTLEFLRKCEVYLIFSLQEMWVNPSVKKALDLSEQEKLQAATDVVEAVYFLHSHQNVSFCALILPFCM